MKKIIRNILIVVYAIIAIFVTICLLSYNDQKVTELGNYALVIIDNDELLPDYKRGDLAIIDQSKSVDVGDKVFFYNTDAKDFEVGYTVVSDKLVIDSNKEEYTYTLVGETGEEEKVSSEYVLGSSRATKRMGTVGTILEILESKWGFLILIVLPAVLAFLYEMLEIFVEMRENKNGGEKRNEELEHGEREEKTRRRTGGRLASRRAKVEEK